MTSQSRLPLDAEALAARLRAVQQDAHESWTPGQALGEILACLARVDDFTDSSSTAAAVRRRLRWLTYTLHSATQRAEADGLEPGLLDGVFTSLQRCDALLSSEETFAGPATRAARDMIRLEISYVVPGK